MATWVVGDIHGCLEEFREMVSLLNLSEHDHLISVGDLVDRGPDSCGVVRQIQDLPCRVTLVMGNHESKHERFRRGNPVKDPHGELREISQGLNNRDIKFLESAQLAVRLSVEGREYTVVHAGIPPYLKHIPETNPQTARDHKWLTMVRYVNPLGNPVSLGAETDQDKFWTEVYDGRFGTVIYGHQPGQDVVYGKHSIGIDLACCFGGHLCAVRLEDQKIVTVPAKRAYAQSRGE